jgi:hypothetical protein
VTVRAGLPLLALLAAFLALSCAGSAPPPPAPVAGASRAPYEAPPAGRHSIEIQVNSRAAVEIFEFVSRPAFDAERVHAIGELPAVRLTVQDSRRTLETFERDLAAAFEEETKSVVFDFHAIRAARPRWEALLAAVPSREADLARMAAERASALLPAAPSVTARLQVYLTFGVAGLADHVVVGAPDGAEAMIVDLARALGDASGESVDNQIERVARLIAGEAFRQAWRTYRAANLAWTRHDASLGLVEPLLQAVGEHGPAALFHVDENFFPLSVWLKEPMKRSIAELNRTAERLVEAEQELEARVALGAEIRRPDFVQRVAAPAGAFLCDGITQNLGLDVLRAALAAGPKALFVAYDRAQRKSRDLIPLSDVIRKRVAEAPK